MKTALLLCLLAGQALASQPVLVRVTARTLAELQVRDPMIRLVRPPESETKVVRPTDQSIIAQSTILHDGTHWTLVPKDAVVFLPETMKSRIKVRPVGTLLQWNEFLTRNQHWVTTTEVTFEQAAGNEALPAECAKVWAQQDKVVVAVLQSGPISVRIADSSHNLTNR